VQDIENHTCECVSCLVKVSGNKIYSKMHISCAIRAQELMYITN